MCGDFEGMDNASGIDGSQLIALHISNLGGGGNDKQSKEVLEYFNINFIGFI